jgi:hypothetical protein
MTGAIIFPAAFLGAARLAVELQLPQAVPTETGNLSSVGQY